VIPTITNKMIRILIATITDILKTSDLSTLRGQMNISFPQHHRSNAAERMFSSAVGHLMLQQLLCEASIDMDLLGTLHFGPYGKMQLCTPKIDFNVSHSGDSVIAVFSDQGRIGVDIEKIRDFNWKACKDLFSDIDWQIICSAEDPQSIFFEFWAKKESFLKTYGLGLQIPCNHIAVRDDVISIENTSIIGHLTSVNNPGYACYVCTEHPATDLQIERFKSFEPFSAGV
jgi:phosphopantetheine--protein transferase-like protein